MNITADTNILVCACVQDNAQQAQLAADVLRKARRIAVSSTTLCKFLWILKRVYQFTDTDIAKTIRLLIHSKNVVCDMPTIKLGLAVFEQGGDFADGIIAFSGVRLGAAEYLHDQLKDVSDRHDLIIAVIAA